MCLPVLLFFSRHIFPRPAIAFDLSQEQAAFFLEQSAGIPKSRIINGGDTASPQRIEVRERRHLLIWLD